MLESLIITSSKMFHSWRTSVILISFAAVILVIAGTLIVVFVHKNRELSSEHNQLENAKKAIQYDHDQLQNEKTMIQDEFNQLKDDNKKMQQANEHLQNENKKIQHAHNHLENENSRIQYESSSEREELLRRQKMIITQVITHLRTHSVDVILDAATAHPRLIVSQDGKQMQDGKTQEERMDANEAQYDKFDEYLGVLGKDGFSSGCFYYEVQVKGQTKWDLGVTRESVNRKGLTSLCPMNGYWIIGQRDETYWAYESPRVFLSMREKPQRVGVFVDYKEGLVSFYDVESMSHIHSYSSQSFNDKLYPFVSLGDLCNENPTPLIIP
ncbi:pyrin-like [Carassius auratus]|uniref:Pyrin-like n=1 Tax=Carassius auratus TaxID=7957 RepID=A0A6P6PGV3_CARAU|nr:pyrin-like [Carassius auratus]